MKIKNLIMTAMLSASLLASTVANAVDRRMQVINNTRYPIVALFASNTSRGTWEENILHGDIMRPHSFITVNFDDDTGRCMFDLKAVFMNGQEVTQPSVNVCTNYYWQINP